MPKTKRKAQPPDVTTKKATVPAKTEKPIQEVKEPCSKALQPLRNEQVTTKSKKCPVECFMKENEKGSKTLCIKNVEDQGDFLQRLTGTPNAALAQAIIDSSVTALPRSMNSATKNNIILQTLADSEPKDAHEARLATQAAVLHTQSMDFLDQARNVLDDATGCMDKQGWHRILTNTATRLLRLHNETLETLCKYRRGGEQRVIVQHVQVNDGGKAIVSGVVEGGGGNGKFGEVIP